MDQYTRDTKGLTSDLGGTNGVTVPTGATEVAPGVYVLGTGGSDTSSWDDSSWDDDDDNIDPATAAQIRSEEHTSELQSLMRISYAVFCLKKKKIKLTNTNQTNIQRHNEIITDDIKIHIHRFMKKQQNLINAHTLL